MGLQGPRAPLGWRPCSGASAPCLSVAQPSSAAAKAMILELCAHIAQSVFWLVFAVTVVGGRTEIGRGCAVALHMLKVPISNCSHPGHHPVVLSQVLWDLPLISWEYILFIR